MVTKHVPLFQVRTAVRGGESVDACERNIDYWKKIYNDNWKLAQQNTSWIDDSGNVDYGDLRRSRQR